MVEPVVEERVAPELPVVIAVVPLPDAVPDELVVWPAVRAVVAVDV